jgi:hypothetical protein
VDQHGLVNGFIDPWREMLVQLNSGIYNLSRYSIFLVHPDKRTLKDAVV